MQYCSEMCHDVKMWCRQDSMSDLKASLQTKPRSSHCGIANWQRKEQTSLVLTCQTMQFISVWFWQQSSMAEWKQATREGWGFTPTLMSVLMTNTHFLMRPTCPNGVLPAGLVCSVVKGPNDPQQGLSRLSAFVWRRHLPRLLPFAYSFARWNILPWGVLPTVSFPSFVQENSALRPQQRNQTYAVRLRSMLALMLVQTPALSACALYIIELQQCKVVSMLSTFT